MSSAAGHKLAQPVSKVWLARTCTVQSSPEHQKMWDPSLPRPHCWVSTNILPLYNNNDIILNFWAPGSVSLLSDFFMVPGGGVAVRITALFCCPLLLWFLALWTTAGPRTTVYKTTDPPLDLWPLDSFFHSIQQESSFSSLWSAFSQTFFTAESSRCYGGWKTEEGMAEVGEVQLHAMPRTHAPSSTQFMIITMVLSAPGTFLGRGSTPIAFSPCQTSFSNY